MARAKKQQRRSFGKVRRLPSGRWQASYADPRGSGQRYVAPRTFDAVEDAQGWCAAERRLIQLGEWTPPAARAERKAEKLVRLREWSESWLAERDLAVSTRSLYRGLLDQRILPALGDENLVEITPAVVRAWWAARDTSTPTRNRQSYRLLRTILATAVEDGLVRENPCQIKGAGKVEAQKELVIPSLDELDALTQEMPEKYRAVVTVGAWCGLRFSELIELRRKDIGRSETGTVLRVRRAAVRVRGHYHVGPPKSEAGVRTIAVPPHVAEVLAAHMKRWTGRGPESFVFPALRGGRLTSSSFGPHYKAAAAAIGRPELRVHDLRHVGATLAAQAGATTAELMARIGHASPGMSLRYQHASADRDRVIAQRLSEIARGEDR